LQDIELTVVSQRARRPFSRRSRWHYTPEVRSGSNSALQGGALNVRFAFDSYQWADIFERQLRASSKIAIEG